MSPSPELSPQSSQPSAADPNPSELAPSTPDAASDVPANSEPESNTADSTSAEAPILRKPPMRPVRPQAAEQPSAAKVGETVPQPVAKLETPTKPISKLEIVSVSSPSAPVTAVPAPLSEEEQAAQAAMRQQPIPPPSEPKQYRAIGLVRGLYTPSEEEFTRGDFKAADGSDLKAVLLGRVMSLVKNHIDLQKEHLWVVYPRTREEEKELHLQIVGVWEPETLKKSELEGEEGTTEAIPDSTLFDPRLDDDYFSVRGEIVFIAPDENYIVVKIQQTPRKSSQKAKAFKLSLRGELESTRTVGYFWDLHIKREDNTLTVTEGTCIGMAPPKKRDKDFVSKGRPRKPSFGRGGGTSKAPIGRSPRPGMPRPVRDPASKPIKRSEQNPAPED